MSQERSLRSADAVIATLLAAATLKFYWPLLHYGVNLADEGYYLYGVSRLAEGQVIYRDFERLYPPGSLYAALPVVRAFGFDPIPIRALWFVVLSVLPSASYLMARTVAPIGVALGASAMMAAFPCPWFKAYVPLCYFAALSIFIAVTSRPRPFTGWFAAGAAIGAIALFRHDIGSFAGIITASLAATGPAPSRGVRPSLRRVGVSWAGLAIGAALVWTPVLAGFAAAGALSEMIEELLFGGARVNAAMSAPWATIADRLQQAGWVGGMVIALPTAAGLAGAALVARAATRPAMTWEHKAVAACVGLLGFAHLHWLQWPDVSHLAQLMPPVLFVGVWIGGRLWRRARQENAVGTWAARLGLVAALLTTSVAVDWGLRNNVLRDRRLAEQSISFGAPWPAIVLTPTRRQQIRGIVDSVTEHTARGEPIFVAPYAPSLYLLTERPNATRYDHVLPGLDEAIEGEIVAELASREVRIVVALNHAFDGREELRFPHYAPRLERYLTAHFVPVARFGEWVVHERRDALPTSPSED